MKNCLKIAAITIFLQLLIIFANATEASAVIIDVLLCIFYAISGYMIWREIKNCDNLTVIKAVIAILAIFTNIWLLSESPYLSACLDVFLNEKTYNSLIMESSDQEVVLKNIDQYNSGPYASSSFTQLLYFRNEADVTSESRNGICVISRRHITSHIFYVETLC